MNTTASLLIAALMRLHAHGSLDQCKGAALQIAYFVSDQTAKEFMDRGTLVHYDEDMAKLKKWVKTCSKTQKKTSQ